MTAKCIAALKKHSALEHQLYVYDNLTNFGGYGVEDPRADQ